MNDKFSLAETKNGSFSLRVTGEDGSAKTIHSLYDPEAEAKAIINDFKFDGRGILVVLGLGLGYHVAELVKRFPDAEIIVVEADPEIYELAKENGASINGNVKLIVGRLPEETLKEISGYQIRDGIKPLSVFALSSVVTAFPSYYQPVLASLRKTVSVRLWDRLKYPKFGKDTLKIILIDSGYFLVREVEKALKALNHKVVKVPVNKNDKSEVIISAFIEAVLNFKPDFLLTINHLGFDEDGVMTSFFKSIEMPVASWYVDSPKIILQAFDKNVSSYVSMFLWDREYMEQIRKSGFESVIYLPLAADEEIFRPMKLKQNDIRKYQNDAGFVGNSLLDSTREKLEKVPEKLHSLIEEAAQQLLTHKLIKPHKSLSVMPEVLNRASSPDSRLLTAGMTNSNDLTLQQRLDLEAAVLWRATLLYRLSCIKELRQFNVCIHGDKGWDQLLGSQYNIKPPLNYYNELPLYYNTCKINFNATHLQMKEAVNQRVFDVPACGAFLLTDYQKSIDELFDAEKEIVIFRDREEIPGLVKYYLNNPEKREAIARKGMERVLQEHTYKHRLVKMIESMKARFREG